MHSGTITIRLGYEPAALTVHPPPRTADGGFIFFNKIAVLQKKYRFLENIKYIFRFWRFFPSFWLLIYLFRSNNKSMNQLFPTSCWIHEKKMKIMSTLYFETPLTAKSWPPIKNFFRHTVLNYFLGKSPQRTIM